MHSSNVEANKSIKINNDSCLSSKATDLMLKLYAVMFSKLSEIRMDLSSKKTGLFSMSAKELSYLLIDETSQRSGSDEQEEALIHLIFALS